MGIVWVMFAVLNLFPMSKCAVLYFKKGGVAGTVKVAANGAQLGESHSYITQTYFLSRNWVPIPRSRYGPPCYIPKIGQNSPILAVFEFSKKNFTKMTLHIVRVTH